MGKTVLQSSHVNKYFSDPSPVQVLKDVSLSVDAGEFVAVTGKSGCGKSTLLYVLSTMDTDFEGELWIDGQAMRGLGEAELARVRNEKIGFVFQFHYLLNEFSVLKNVMLPGLKLGRFSEKEVEHRALERLRMLGIEGLALKNANRISGGEKQRVAIARALINDPLVVLGDEPTGNLDKKNSDTVFDIFKRLCEEFGQTLLVVTHDESFARGAHRIVEMEDGRIVLP